MCFDFSFTLPNTFFTLVKFITSSWITWWHHFTQETTVFSFCHPCASYPVVCFPLCCCVVGACLMLGTRMGERLGGAFPFVTPLSPDTGKNDYISVETMILPTFTSNPALSQCKFKTVEDDSSTWVGDSSGGLRRTAWFFCDMVQPWPLWPLGESISRGQTYLSLSPSLSASQS